MRREYVYKGFERFWHWTQAALILFLALTGFEIHGSLAFFGFEQAVAYHSAAAWALLVLIAFAIFWHLTTGEWRQYVPTLENLRAQAEYYVDRHLPLRARTRPARRALSKLNPLQRLVYLALKVLVIPVIVTSGLLYMFYRYPQRHAVEALDVKGLAAIAVLHTAGAFFLVAFLIGHLYLITTGHTLIVQPEGDDHRLGGPRGRARAGRAGVERRRRPREHPLHEPVPGRAAAGPRAPVRDLRQRPRPRRERRGQERGGGRGRHRRPRSRRDARPSTASTPASTPATR